MSCRAEEREKLEHLVRYVAPPDKCFDYLVLDSWFGGMRDNGTVKSDDRNLMRLVREMDYKRLHFLDQYGIWGRGYNVGEVLTSHHQLIKEINEYGPTIFIYARDEACPI